MSERAGIKISQDALDFLAAAPPKVCVQLAKRLKGLAINPYPQGCKKLDAVTTSDGSCVYRERSGDYRILYAVKGNPGETVILDIDHRKDVYR